MKLPRMRACACVCVCACMCTLELPTRGDHASSTSVQLLPILPPLGSLGGGSNVQPAWTRPNNLTDPCVITNRQEQAELTSVRANVSIIKAPPTNIHIQDFHVTQFRLEWCRIQTTPRLFMSTWTQWRGKKERGGRDVGRRHSQNLISITRGHPIYILVLIDKYGGGGSRRPIKEFHNNLPRVSTSLHATVPTAVERPSHNITAATIQYWC